MHGACCAPRSYRCVSLIWCEGTPWQKTLASEPGSRQVGHFGHAAAPAHVSQRLMWRVPDACTNPNRSGLAMHTAHSSPPPESAGAADARSSSILHRFMYALRSFRAIRSRNCAVASSSCNSRMRHITKAVWTSFSAAMRPGNRRRRRGLYGIWSFGVIGQPTIDNKQTTI